MKKERRKERDEHIGREEPFRSCYGLRIAVTCHPQIRPFPKHVRLGLLLFIYSAFPSIPLLASRSPSPFVSCALLSPSIFLPPLPPSSFLLMSRIRSGIDRCHRRTNMPGRTCQRVLMSSVIVINTLIRTVAKTSVTCICGSLRNIKYSAGNS